jgi:hypothetical protein
MGSAGSCPPIEAEADNTNSPDAIFRTERGRMRNQWFPAKKAEYMTASRFQELGLTRRDIGDRDATYGTLEAAEVEVIPEPEVPITTVVTASVRVPRCLCYLLCIPFHVVLMTRNNSPRNPILS